MNSKPDRIEDENYGPGFWGEDNDLTTYQYQTRDSLSNARRVAALLASILCAACGYDPLEFDVSSLTPAHQTHVAWAMGDWCEVVPDRCPSIGPSSSRSYIAVSNELSDGVWGQESDQGPGMARRILVSNVVDLEPDSEMLWLRVLRHELGHAMGCKRHSEDIGEVMAQDVFDQADYITEDDVACVLSGKDPRE